VNAPAVSADPFYRGLPLENHSVLNIVYQFVVPCFMPYFNFRDIPKSHGNFFKPLLCRNISEAGIQRGVLEIFARSCRT
jgi:hypothetical protein